MALAKHTVRLSAFVGALATVGFQIYAAGFPDQGVNLGNLLIAFWGIAPFALMFLMSFFMPLKRRGRTILSVGSVLLVIATGVLLLDAFILNPGAQSGIMFLFLPVVQGVAIVICGIGAKWLDCYIEEQP